MPTLGRGAFKPCLLLSLFIWTADSEQCTGYAHTFIEQTPELYGDSVAFNFTRVDGFDQKAEIKFLKVAFEKFIRCLQTSPDGGCIIYVVSQPNTGDLFHYRSLSTQGGSGGNPSTSNNYACQLPNTFYNNPSPLISCSESKEVRLQECFNSPTVCISFIPQNADGTQTVYNVIWNSRGNITFSYNKNFVIIEPCSKHSSGPDNTGNEGVIVGVVFAVLVIVILIIIVVIYWRRKRPSAAKGLRHYEGTPSSVAIAALDQTDPSAENVETSFSRNAYSTVDKAYSSPYEQVDTNGAGYSTVHIDKIESKDENQKHGQQGNITKPDVWPSSTINQHLPASAEDGTIHNSEPGHEYSKLHENKRNFTNPYNELSKPTEDSQRQPIPILDASSGGLSSEASGPYSLAKPFRTPYQTEGDFASHRRKLNDTQPPAKKPMHKFKLKESPESACASDTTDSNSPENKERKYFVLEKEDGPAEIEDAESKGLEDKYFILEKESGNTETDN